MIRIGTWLKSRKRTKNVCTERDRHLKKKLIEMKQNWEKNTFNKSNQTYEPEESEAHWMRCCYYWQQHLLHIENEWSKAVERLFFRCVDFVFDVFFVIRLGVQNEHITKKTSKISICTTVVCICLVIGVRTVFFSLFLSPVICSLYNVHMHTNDCFITSFYFTKIEKKNCYCVCCAHSISTL